MEKSTKDSFMYETKKFLENSSEGMIEKYYEQLVKKGFRIVKTEGIEELSQDREVDKGELSERLDLPNHGSLPGRNP